MSLHAKKFLTFVIALGRYSRDLDGTYIFQIVRWAWSPRVPKCEPLLAFIQGLLIILRNIVHIIYVNDFFILILR